MLNKDKVFLFERYSLYTIKQILSKINKRKLIRSTPIKLEYANSLIRMYQSNYIKRWVVSLLSVISKKGNNIKYNNYIAKVLVRIKQKYNLFQFFSIIEENLTIIFNTFKKRIAGKNLLIPIGLSSSKRVNAMSKLIITSLKLRKERVFIDKLYNELLDTYNNKGLSIIKKLNYTKQLKDIITNIRFLNEKY